MIRRSACAMGAMILGICPAMASAGPVAPLDTPEKAARGALTALSSVLYVPGYVESLETQSRSYSAKALRLLNSATTFKALRAARNGVVVACPLGGTVTARLSRPLPTVLKLEWSDCASSWVSGVLTLNGPGELLLLESSLAPANLAGIRMGDAQRDHVATWVPTTTTNFYHEYRNNLRMVGLLPIAPEDEDGIFPSRATYEVTGFNDFIQFSHDRGGGLPDSVEFYPFHAVLTADHVFLTRERRSTGSIPTGDAEYSTETRIYWGRIDATYRRDPTPRHPTPIFDQTYVRAWDLRIFSRDYSQASPGVVRQIDGKVEINISDDWILGCSAPDTYRFRTTVPLTVSPDDFWYIYGAGELAINDAKVRFSQVGEPPDLAMRVAIDAPAAGQFSYDLPAGWDFQPLVAAAQCSP